MRGARRKAIRKAFLDKYGRAPRKAKFDRFGEQVQRDEMRPLKRAHVRGGRP